MAHHGGMSACSAIACFAKNSIHMFTLSKKQQEEIARILVEESGLSPFDVELFLSEFTSINDIFAPAIERWLEDRTIVDLSVEGVTISEVMKKRKCHFLAAVKDLNMLLDETIPASQRERFKETLTKYVHYDTIVIDDQSSGSGKKMQ